MTPRVLAFAAVGLLAAAVLHVATPARDARPAAAAAKRFAPFPKRLVATAPPVAPQTSASWERVEQQLASVNAMWQPLFAAAGDRYEAPTLVPAGEDGCGAPSAAAGNWAGLYCTATRNIVIDLDSHATRHAATGGYVADVVLGYIVAHEVGHHVQTLRGAPRTDPGPRVELHADCLAGVWGRAAGLPLPPTWKYASDAEHGTAAQRMRWLARGHLHGRPADCDTIWAGEPL
ncbi:MAG TPA: neutral zinc metallopeptidase [Solirubrobacteraceae bacterium]|nr:neutral zinc metallopeptidase [Solirubrobacteraceae bacterium]